MLLTPADSRFAMANDTSAWASVLAKQMSTAVSDVKWNELSVTKALPHRSSGFILQYNVPLEDGGTLNLGGYLPGDAADRPAWAGKAPGSAWLPEPGLAIAVPSADPKLNGIARVLDHDWLRDLASRQGWNGSPLTTLETLAYRLEKRFVCRLGNGRGDSAVIKVVRPRKLEAMVSAHSDSVRSFPSAFPEVLHVDVSAGAMVMEDVPGIPLNEIDPGDTEWAFAQAGKLLRSYHEPPKSGASFRTVTDELIQLREWTGISSRLHPVLAGSFAAAFRNLVDGPSTDGFAPVRLHRDFYDKQILIDPDRITLLDLDTAASGDPALDIGNFLAHIRLRQRQYPGTGAVSELAAKVFLVSYGVDELLARRIAWWRTAALLRLAAIYSFRPRWWHLTPELLEDVDACLRKPEALN